MKVTNKSHQSTLDHISKTKLQFAQKSLRQKVIHHKHNGLKMRFDYFVHGQKPANGYRLVFGLHGGGGCPFEVNQQQWNNHKHLYDQFIPPGTIWFVPRSPQQASDMWWKDYIPEFFETVIYCFKIMKMIDPNRVFISGYSAGGDGIYHLAGMMADLLAGAAMMAGHPNKADVYNLRNLAFSIQVGGQDHAYDRANWGKVYMNKVKQLQNEYGGFKQYSEIHNCGHWMQKKDALIFPNFLNEVRNPYPEFILFRQHKRNFKKSFYYLKLQEKHEGLICVRRKGNFFEIEAEMKIPIKVMLNSNFVDLSKQVIIKYNGAETVITPNQTEQIVKQTAQQFLDPWYIFESEIWCIPGTNLPKRPLRPFEMEHTQSSLERIREMQNNIREDEKLHVSFHTERNNLVGQISQTHRIHGDDFSNKSHNKLKRVEQSFERCCEIY